MGEILKIDMLGIRHIARFVITDPSPSSNLRIGLKTRYLSCLRLLLSLSTAVAVSPAIAQGGWTSLFNGTNLAGWVEHSGKAKFMVEDGVLVGESVPRSGNSFLCTTQAFENFLPLAVYPSAACVV